MFFNQRSGNSRLRLFFGSHIRGLAQPDWFEENDDNDDGNDDSREAGSGEEAVVPGGTQHILVLLDCAESMFENTMVDPEFPEENISAVSFSLSALQQTIRRKIRAVTIQKTGKRDGVGVLLFNTKRRTPMLMPDSEVEETKEMKSNTKGGNSDDDDDDDDDYYDLEEDESEELMYGRTGPQLTTVHELLPLAPPGVATVKRLQAVLEDPFTGNCEIDLKLEYCRVPDEEEEGDTEQRNPSLLTALSEAISCYKKAACVKKSTARTKFEEADSKQIWILTDNDNPVRDKETARVVQEKASDAKDNGIDLFVWPVGNRPFDVSKFYDTIASITVVAHEADATEWVRLLESRFKKTRPAYRVPLLLPNWALKEKTKDSPQTIQLDFYNLQQTAKDPTAVQIHQETGKLLSKVRQILTNDGGEVLVEHRSFEKPQKKKPLGEQMRLRNFVEFAGHDVAFSLSDKVDTKKQCNANQDFASLILLGFKRETAVPFYHSVEKSYFAYPSDAASADAFAHLHQNMLRRGVIAVGELLTRVTATSRLVVLRPLQEVVEMVEGGMMQQSRPPGMLVTDIPFEDEMRAIEPDVATKTWEETGYDLAAQDMIKAAMNLVQKQTLVGVEIGEDFENAAMCRFWNYVEHVALDEGLRADKPYDTEIDKGEVLKHAGEEIDEFVALLPDDIKPEQAPRKRKIEPDDSGVDWGKVYMGGAVSRCKVADLKKKLKSVGELVSGNKSVVSSNTPLRDLRKVTFRRFAVQT